MTGRYRCCTRWPSPQHSLTRSGVWRSFLSKQERNLTSSLKPWITKWSVGTRRASVSICWKWIKTCIQDSHTAAFFHSMHHKIGPPKSNIFLCVFYSWLCFDGPHCDGVSTSNSHTFIHTDRLNTMLSVLIGSFLFTVMVISTTILEMVWFTVNHSLVHNLLISTQWT